MQTCDAKAKAIRMNDETKVMNNNLRCYGDEVIIKEGKIVFLPVKKLIREVDVEEEEFNYVNNKFKDKAHSIEKGRNEHQENKIIGISNKILLWMQSIWRKGQNN